MIRIIATINNEDTEVGLQPISCVLSMSINGVWVVKMEHPYDREGRWQYVTEDAVIIAEVTALDGIATEQKYRIHLVQRTLTSIYVEAYPIALDAFNDKVFTSVARNGATPSRLALDITSTDYPVTTNLPNTLLADYKYENTNLIAIINGGENCFVEKYGGEIKYNNKNISINQRLDNGDTAYIYVGRDVTSLMHTINTTDVITRIYPLSANGSRLNANPDARVDPYEPYVDSAHIDDYEVIHAEFVKTHMMLCTEDEKNEDQEAYSMTMNFRSTVIEIVSDIMDDLAQRRMVSVTKMNLEYLQDILKLTKEKNKTSGIIERLQQAITASIGNVAYKQMVSNWIKEACDEFDNIDPPEYELIMLDGTHYIYADKDDHSNRVYSEWVNINNKWRWFDANGYLVESEDNTSRWGWWQKTGTHAGKVYGSKSDGIYVHDQWLKVNGTWYWFDEYGLHISTKNRVKDICNWIISFYDVTDYQAEVADQEKELFEQMYTRMVFYCEWLYGQGVDRPKMEINLEAMDISQIEGYQQLRTLHLGNNVILRNNGTNISERVVELEYDCIRKVNTRIVLGMPTETISAIITRNIETNPALIAGYGVDIDGNVINIASGGGEVKGLRWWEETANHIERSITSIPSGGWTCDDRYLMQGEKNWQVSIDQGYAIDHFNKTTTGKAVGAWMKYKYPVYDQDMMGPVILSPVENDVAMQSDIQGEGNCYAFSNTISYGGTNWYVSGGTLDSSNPDTFGPSSQSAGNYACWDNENRDYSGDLPVVEHQYESFYDAVMALFEIANVRTQDSYITGINVGEAYPFYGGYVASGAITPENAPFRVRRDGTIYGKDVVCGNHTLSNKQNNLTAGDNITISGDEISATDTTYDVFEEDVDGLVPAPTSADTNKFLKSDGTWAEAGGGYMSYSGTSVPSSSLGNDGDHYYRLDSNGNIIEEYIKLSGSWILLPKSDAVLNTKTITSNGTYAAASDDLDGYSSVTVNVPSATLTTKTITQNGTYNASSDNADGYSQVVVNVSGGGSASIERLCYAYEDYDELGDIDHNHIAYFDAITKDADYSSYLSNNSIASGEQTSVTFTVTQAFTALITAWVTNYKTASGGTTSEGQILINSSSIMEDIGYDDDMYKCEDATIGTKAGLTIVHTFAIGDTLEIKTPSGNGWPQQSLKIYRVIDSNISSAFSWS